MIDRRATVLARGLCVLIGGFALLVSVAALVIEFVWAEFFRLHANYAAALSALSVGHGIVAIVFIPLGLLVQRRGARMWLPRLLFLLIPVFLVYSVDRTLNAFNPPIHHDRVGIFERHPRRGWTHIPLSHGLKDGVETYIDRYGMRVTASDWQRVLGRRPRILCLGDSVTFGYKLPARQGYVERLQGLLAMKDAGRPRFIVLNGGTIAAAPPQELDWLTHEGEAIAPDLVVVQICLNDLTYLLHPASEGISSARDGNGGRDEPHWSALMRLAFRWGRKQEFGDDLAQAAEEIETENFDKLLDPQASKSMWVYWDKATSDWASMIDFCESRGMPIAFMIVPLDVQIDDRTVSSEPQSRISSFAKTRGIRCLDLLPILRAKHLDEGVPMSDLYNDYTHPSPNGNKIIARALLDFLEESGLLKRARAHWSKSGEH